MDADHNDGHLDSHGNKSFSHDIKIHPGILHAKHHSSDSKHGESKVHLKHGISDKLDEKKSKHRDMSDSLTEPDDPEEVHHRATLEL